MVIGCITMYSVNLWRSESGCKSDANHIFYGGIMYGSYLVLFVQFFISAYFGKSPAPSGQKKVMFLIDLGAAIVYMTLIHQLFNIFLLFVNTLWFPIKVLRMW